MSSSLKNCNVFRCFWFKAKCNVCERYTAKPKRCVDRPILDAEYREELEYSLMSHRQSVETCFDCREPLQDRDIWCCDSAGFEITWRSDTESGSRIHSSRGFREPRPFLDSQSTRAPRRPLRSRSRRGSPPSVVESRSPTPPLRCGRTIKQNIQEWLLSSPPVEEVAQISSICASHVHRQLSEPGSGQHPPTSPWQ